jgi:hypothetical protein
VIAKVQPGANPIDICREGDKLIEEKVGKIFNKKVRPTKRNWGGWGGGECTGRLLCLCSFHPSIYPSIHPSIHPPLHPPVRLSVHPSVRASACVLT